MEYHFTTGSCAAAAAKAAAYMLLSGRRKDKIVIETPKKIPFHATILDIQMTAERVSCGVKKDGGEDPDVTTGSIVYATVSYSDRQEEVLPGQHPVLIDGGEGIGRVTKAGLDQPVGNAAINSVPRQMIEGEVAQVMKFFDCPFPLQVIISVPGGEEIARKTFNPRLGIEGGISILGTSGLVEPMSVQALLDTIRVELHQKRVLGKDAIAVAPGNYGLDFMKNTYDFDLDQAVKCSNYIGATLDMIAEEGFSRVLLCGHIGKLIKVTGGIMNTHSAEADCRIELMVNAALSAGLGIRDLRKLQGCLSTDAAYEILLDAGLTGPFMDIVMDRIHFYLKKRAGERFAIECIVFSNAFGLLGQTPGALTLLKELKDE